MITTIPNSNPRVIVIQKLYSQYINKDQKIEFKKHRYKKFIKDIVLGTLERKELIEEIINKHLKKDIDKKVNYLALLLLLLPLLLLLCLPSHPRVFGTSSG